MFDDEILEVERRALILFLSQVSFKLNLKREANSKKKFSKYIITSDDKTFNVSFDFEDPEKNTSELLHKTLIFVFDEFDFVLDNIENDMDMLSQVTLFHNGIVGKIKEDLTKYTAISLENESPSEIERNILAKKSNITKINKAIKNYSQEEKDALSLCECILDHVTIHEVLIDGADLLDFLEGTLIVKNCLDELITPESLKNFLDSLTKESQ